mgnify:CR=1 FL=1
MLFRSIRRYGHTKVGTGRKLFNGMIRNNWKVQEFSIRDISKYEAPLGIKPLYVADDGSTVRIASQVKALLAGGQIDTRPDPAGHCGFFLWGSVPDPYTLYRGIRALPAGHTQWIDARGAEGLHHICYEVDDIDQALAAWRGAPYRELPDDDRANAEAARLEVVHQSLQEVRAESLLAAGRAREAIGDLERQIGRAHV